MGSHTELRFKKYVLYFSKNHLFTSDGMGFFKPSDKQNIVYEYANNVREEHPAYIRKLSTLKDRLDLLGYTLPHAEIAIKESIHDDISLEEFIGALSFINFDEDSTVDFEVNPEDSMRYENLWELGGFIINSPEAIKILEKYRYDEDYLESREPIDPILVLRCLAEIEKHADGDLIWEYYDLVLGGWIEERDIQIKQDRPTFLILTEGKIDTDIIEKSIKSFKPDVSDLFFFADTENHPFGGTNDIAKFVKGLIDIKYQGNILVILDNDLAGNEALQKIERYKLPRNFNVMTLPKHPDFSNVETIGTNGKEIADINGRAVSIECFLDFASTQSLPKIRWTNWDDKQEKYHGRFDDKIKNELKLNFDNSYKNAFQSYNTEKLKYLADYIIENAKELSRNKT